MNKLYTLLAACTLYAGAATAQNFTAITGNIVTQNSFTSWGNSWIDYNNDGKLDLFVMDKDQHRLYRNDGSGVFTNITPANLASPVPLGFYYSSAWGDYNNDGNLDVILGNDGDKRALYKGDGNGGFTTVTTGTIVTDMFHSFNLSWVDYNNDGYLDLFCSNIGNTSYEKNNLYKGNSGTSFTKITVGNIVNDIDESWAHSWADYDNDGCEDLFVANLNNDFLYHNNCDGTFTKITTGTIVNDGKNSQGASWGDYDNDGYLDLFVAVWQDNCMLYHNNGDGTFTKLFGTPLDNNIDKCTGSGWADYDNDGFIDLFVCSWDQNGNTHNRLYHNNGNSTFTEITNSPLTAATHASNGCAWADYDNDGFQDLHVTNKSLDNELFHNDGNNNKFITIKCKGVVSNRSGIGAKVRVKAVINGTPTWQLREVGSMAGQFAQGNMYAAFGLANATTVDSMIVEWPSGTKCKFVNINTNQFLEIEEGCTYYPLSVSNSKIGTGIALENAPNPFTDLTKITYTITEVADVSLVVTDVTGKKVIGVTNKAQIAGTYETVITSQQLGQTGMYFYTLTVGKQVYTGKMLFTGN